LSALCRADSKRRTRVSFWEGDKLARRDELEAALLNPSEDLSFEYKAWLDLGSSHGKATLAKAVIAMANADGGYVVIGFSEDGAVLQSVPQPDDIREITQDIVNGAIQRYVSPALHVRMEVIQHPITGVRHPVVVVPSTAMTPVMAVRDCDGVLQQARVYVRKPGPRSEEPKTVDEWRVLLDRCVQRSRASMLDAIRTIVEGRIDEVSTAPNIKALLATFAADCKARHEALLDKSGLPADAVARTPLGRYEMCFAFQGAQPASSLTNLRRRIDEAHRVKLTGWPTFLVMTRQEMAPYASDGGVEAWMGQPGIDRYLGEDAAHSNYWRILPTGMLYTATGYDEDGAPGRADPGTAFDLILPVWRVGDALLYARRLAATFEGVESIVTWVRWSGLSGRSLRVMSGNRMQMSYDRLSRTPEVESSMTIMTQQIDDNLPEVLQALLAPVYELFEFYELPRQIVDQELERLMRRG
jgi:Putative DNA-binding domain